jgi:cytochrome c oxidase subunit 1
VPIASADEVAHKGDAKGVHLPSPSFWPIVIAVGLPIVAYGVIYNLWLCVPGAILVIGGLFGFAMEPADDPEAHAHGDEHDEHGAELALTGAGSSATPAGAEEGDHG